MNTSTSYWKVNKELVLLTLYILQTWNDLQGIQFEISFINNGRLDDVLQHTDIKGSYIDVLYQYLSV